MKYITQDWTSTKDGYLFFVQRLQEMLFHYSDDIVKAPVHNTQTLLEEYVDTEKDVVKGSIKQYQLDIIAKEIKSSLMTDVIVRELYKYEVIEEMAKFLDKDQRTAVHYIFNKIPKKKYYEICCKYLKEKETYSQLNKIVDLHNAALNQQDLNDAFLNLWSALEVASVTDSSKSKIESVTDNIVSILQNDYFECIFSNILDDLKNNLGNRKVSLLLKDITEFDKEICKIAGFIFLEKYEKYREDYFANELKYYPNIRYKIYNLYEQRENREKLWHLSEKYCQRIEWHLYRLYRLRNAIVHAGESHKRIQMLGEHLHIYVDRVILELMVKLAKDKCLGTIQDVFTDTYLLLNKKKKNLKEPGNVDEQSIMLLLENFFIEE